jgi:hypothetical protein
MTAVADARGVAALVVRDVGVMSEEPSGSKRSSSCYPREE